MRPFLAALTATLLLGPAVAHEWYPPFCCTNNDCAPLASSRVQQTPDGFTVDGKHYVPRKDVRDSMDGRYHACFPNPNEMRCFFAPPANG